MNVLEERVITGWGSAGSGTRCWCVLNDAVSENRNVPDASKVSESEC